MVTEYKEHLSQNIIDQIEQAAASVLETSDYSPLDKHSGVLKITCRAVPA